MTAAERKQRLRRQAAALPKLDEPALVAAFLALPQVAEADTVMLFCGVGRELDTTPCWRPCWSGASGCATRCACPGGRCRPGL